MRQRRKHATAARRGTAPRARRCATATPTRPRSAAPTQDNATAEKHARRIAKLRTVKRKLGQRVEHVSALLDNALIAARNDKVKHAAIAHVVQVAEGRPQTEADFVQLEAELRKLTHYALRRRDPQRIETKLDAKNSRRETGRMRKPIYVRESYYSPDYLPPDSGVAAPPEAELADPEDLGGPEDLGEPDLEDDDDLHDEDLDDDLDVEEGDR